VVRPIVALLALRHGQSVRKLAASVVRLLTEVDDAESDGGSDEAEEDEAEGGTAGEDDDTEGAVSEGSVGSDVDSEAGVEDEGCLEHLHPPQGED
jgi:hypothetical protein